MVNQFHFHGTVCSYVRIGSTMSNVVAYIGLDNAPTDQNVQLLYYLLLSIPILPVSISLSNGYFLFYQLFLIIDCTAVTLVMRMLTHQVHILYLLLFLLMINMLNSITIDTKIFLSLITNLYFPFKKQSKVTPKLAKCGKRTSIQFFFSQIELLDNNP